MRFRRTTSARSSRVRPTLLPALLLGTWLAGAGCASPSTEKVAMAQTVAEAPASPSPPPPSPPSLGAVASSTTAHAGVVNPDPDLAAPAAAEEPNDEGATRRYVVAAMGDSLTDPRSHGGKYLDVLRERCPKSRFDSYGIGGNMVNQMRSRFARDVLGDPPDAKDPKPSYTHVIILGGINDICSDESALRTNDKIKRDLSAMYRSAREAGMKVIAVTLPPWGGFDRYYNPRRAASTRDMNAWLKARGPAGEVDAVFDVYPLMSCGDSEMLCEKYGWPDKVHWNAEGHRVAGAAMHEALFSDCQ